MSERSAMKKRTPAKCWAVVDEFGGIWAHQVSRRFAVVRKGDLKRSGIVGRLTVVLLVERRKRRKKR